MKQDHQAPAGSTYDDNEIVNHSVNTHFDEVLSARLTRRQTVLGGISATTAALFGSAGLAACGGSEQAVPVPPVATPEVKPLSLGFTAWPLYTSPSPRD